ncbi:golgin subfamily A member 6-like protein 6 [Macrobrachium rosenbergii]|uniref:golgin subfamily A member 6-like protein 6 n=1 Tax=Macrobrachium rosenbergii TaxID=79674 RepID=UPI0034D502D4
MFFVALKAVCLKAFVTAFVLFGALFTGLNHFARLESGVLHQLVACEQCVLDLKGRVDTLNKSSTVLRIRINFKKETIDSWPVAALRRILSFCPRVGRFLKSRQDLQRCEILARNLERKLEKVESKLGFFQFLKTRLNENAGIVCVYSGMCLTIGGILLMLSMLYNNKEEIHPDDEQQEENGFEVDWSSMDSCSLDEAEETVEERQNLTEKNCDSEEKQKLLEMEKLFEEEKSLFEKRKEELEAEIGRLSNKIGAIQKEREAEIENATKTVNGLKEVNHQHKSEIIRLSKMIQTVQKEKQAVTERSMKTANNLIQTNKELEAEADLVYSDYQALQKQREEEKESAKKTIRDLEIIKDQLLMEIANTEASAEQHRDETEELKQSIRLLKEEVERAKEKNRAQIAIQSQLLKEKKQREEETESAKKTINDLEIIKDQLLMEIANTEASVEEHRNETEELKQSIRLLKGELERAKEKNRAHIEIQSQQLKEKEKLQKTMDEQGQIIEEMSEKNRRLEKELMDAKINDFVRGERYETLVTELQAFKKRASVLENETASGEPELEDIKEEVVKVENKVIEERVKDRQSQEDGVDKREAHNANEGCQNPQKAKRDQRKLITFDLEPDQPQMKSSVFSRLASRKASPEMIVTAKERVKDRKREEEIADKKEPQKADEGCQKPQKAKKDQRKLITFDLEPDHPQMEGGILSHHSRFPPRHGPTRQDQEDNCIIFMGEKVQLKRLEEMEGEVTIELDVPRNFHRAINGVQGRTLEEITERSGVAFIEMPGRFEASNLITIAGTVQQVRLAADHIERLISKLH